MHGLQIRRQRCLQIGLSPEENESDLIAMAPVDESAGDFLHRFKARGRAAHIGRRHGSGDVHGEDQPSARGGHRHGIAQPLGSRRREQQRATTGRRR